jgi:hypothetical protein
MNKKDMVREVANTFKCPGVVAGKCDNEFQDDRYGKGQRIFTTTHKDNKDGKRCTVCETTA